MRYMLLIYTSEAADGNATQADRDAMMRDYNAFTEDAQKKGVMIGGEALHPTSAATTVKLRDGKKLTTDGPFAETKEQLGGYYLMNCKDLNEAIEWGAKIPGARYGSIEIRPIMEFGA